jgi:hypothetical protein
MKFKLLWSLAAAFALVACGGGGGGGGTTPPPDGGGGNNPPATGVVWETLPYIAQNDQFLQQANAQGARGFYYVGSQAFRINPTTGVAEETVSTYVKGPGTYSYKILTPPTSSATFVAQTNQQGALGYQVLGTVQVDALLYVKDNASSDTYSLELLDYTNTSDAYLSQKNSQGARGFYTIGDYTFDPATSATFFSMYVKNNASSATFEYALELAGPSSIPGPQELITQANARGQQGYQYIGGNVFLGNAAGDQFRNVYVKDISQTSATFSFSALDPADSSAAFVTQANAQAQAGALYYGGQAFPTTDPLVFTVKSFYFTPSNCTGILCSAQSPL